MDGLKAYILSKSYVDSTLKGEGALQGKPGADGKDGKSAYEIAVSNGFVGNEKEWIDSLKGSDGKTPDIKIGSNNHWFIDGIDTNVSAKGEKGDTGTGFKVTKQYKSVSDMVSDKTPVNDSEVVVVISEDTGTFYLRLSSYIDPNGTTNGYLPIGSAKEISAIKGEKGDDGITPHIGSNRNWFIGDTDTGVLAEGTNGTDGKDGANGKDGTNGKSAYEIAKEEGFSGTESEWLQSLKGIDGTSPTVITDKNNTNDIYKLVITDKNGEIVTPNLKGNTGKDGYTPNFSIGTVTTLPSTSQATVSITGTQENPILNIGIPRGENGIDSETKTDEKVKMSVTDSDAKYLEDFIDSDTISIDSNENKFYVTKLKGQSVSVAEINFLKGINANIQQQLDNLGRPMSMYGVFDTKADLLVSDKPCVDGNTAIVVNDESMQNKQMTYIYIEQSSEWFPVAESAIAIRDFILDPIDLDTETKGIISEVKIDKNIARLSQVLDKQSYAGSENGVVKSADTIKEFAYTIKELNDSVKNSHEHINASALNKIIENGLGNRFLSDNGSYSELFIKSSSEPIKKDILWIDTSDVSKPLLKFFNGNDWIVISGTTSGGNGSSQISISSEKNNAIINKDDGIYVEDKSNEISELFKRTNNINVAQSTVNEELHYCFCEFNAIEENLTLSLNDIIPFNKINSNLSVDDSNYSILLKGGHSYKISSQLYGLSKSGIYSLVDLTHDLKLKECSFSEFGDSCMLNTIITPDDDIDICIKITHISDDSGDVVTTKDFNASYFIILENNRQIIIDSIEHVNSKNGIEDTPVGQIIEYAGINAPNHYLKCDGSEYKINDYPYLVQHFINDFSVVNSFGGNGVDTFAVPNYEVEYRDITPNMTSNTSPAPYVASSDNIYSAGYEPYRAFNNSDDTYCSLNSNPCYLKLDMGNKVYFNRITLTCKGNYYPIKFNIEISDNDKDYTIIESFGNNSTPNISSSFPSAKARFIKINVFNSNSYCEIHHMRIYVIKSTRCIKYEPTYFMNLQYTPIISDFGVISSSLSASNEVIRTLWSYTNKENQSIRIKLKDLVASTNVNDNEGFITVEIQDTITQNINLPTGKNTSFDVPEFVLPQGKSIVIKTNWEGKHSSCTFNLNGRFISVTDVSKVIDSVPNL